MVKSQWMETQNGNFSNGQNDTFDPANDYIGVRLQQGVPLLDRDWNELEDIRRYQEVSFRKKYIGDGTPDATGFQIVALASPGNDFTIKAGRYLVSGFDVYNDGDFQFNPNNGNRLNPPTSGIRTDQVYLEVTVQEIRSTGNTDDPLQNSNDVGMETCIRHKLHWEVKVAEEPEIMQPSDKYNHRVLLAIIKRTGQIISSDQITDKRIKLITMDDNGKAVISGGATIDHGATIANGARIASGNLNIDEGDLNIFGNAAIDYGISSKYGGISVYGDVSLGGSLIINCGDLWKMRFRTETYVDGLGTHCRLIDEFSNDGGKTWNTASVPGGGLLSEWITNSVSDKVLKTDIEPLTEVLQKIDRIQGVSFNWNDKYKEIYPNDPFVNCRQIGMIAQEIQEIFPEFIYEIRNLPEEDRKLLGLDYSRFTAVLLQAVKELKAQNQSLLERIEALEKRTDA